MVSFGCIGKTRRFEKETQNELSRKESQNLSWVCVGVMCLTMVTLATAKPPSILSVRSNSRQIGLYEKLELRIDLEATYTNPFDPEEIDLTVEFTAPSGDKWNICGFYNPSAWTSLWMARFSPDRERRLAVRGYRDRFGRHGEQPSRQIHRRGLGASWICQDCGQSAVSQA